MKNKLGKIIMVRCETCDGYGEVAARISMTNDVCDVEICKVCKGTGKVPEGHI